jgi:hypothetical protein
VSQSRRAAGLELRIEVFVLLLDVLLKSFDLDLVRGVPGALALVLLGLC